ncbi:MAG: DNA-directed RNA polymerase subunit alpha C-terminal domain-containing protein [Clostridia bacterium]|nr:DNA-directed RNA polymerase subunit alpha C-terminal domain-containing protein [Clostridia bacterium]
MNDIIDFDSFRRRTQRDGLPELPAVDEVTEIVTDRMLRATLLMEMTAEVMKAVAAAGMDPAEFHVEAGSVDRFFGTDRIYDDDAMFNGVCFDQLGEDWLVRAAVTVYLLDEDEEQEEGDAESQLPCELSVDFFRIAEDMDHWQVLDEDGEWSDDGPPEDLFDLLDELDELDEDDEFDEDDEGDHWRSDRTLTMLDISVDTYNALDEAGIYTMDELSEMTERAVEAIVGPKGLEEVELALAEEGLRLRKR